MTRLEKAAKHYEKTDQCWIWKSCRMKSGYGKVSYRGKSELAHRVIWQLVNGKIPPGMCVLHKCDNTSCVNPDHLFLGSKADNSRDMAEKGRSGKRKTSLTASDVINIRTLDLPARNLSSLYGMSVKSIYKIKNRER